MVFVAVLLLRTNIVRLCFSLPLIQWLVCFRKYYYAVNYAVVVDVETVTTAREITMMTVV